MNIIKRLLAVTLCLLLLCVVGCSKTDDTITTTTTTQGNVTTTTVADTTMTTTLSENTTASTTTTTESSTITETSTTIKVSDMTTTTTALTTTTQATTTKPDVPAKVITCYGDSITDGLGVGPNQTSDIAKGSPYPTVLQKLLGTGYQVQNAGDSGEKTPSIMARQGALKVYLKNDVTFAVGSTQVLLEDGTGRGVITSNGLEVQWTSPFGKDLPIHAVTIDGKPYKLQFSNQEWSTFKGKTYLTRADGSKALTIPKGTEVVINTATTSKSNYCDIYLMGFNGTYADVNDLIAQYQKMIDYRHDDNYLIIVPCFQKNAEFIQAFKTAFGDRAVDFWGYTQNKTNIERAGVTVSNADLLEIRRGMIPSKLKYYPNDANDVHLSATGYKVLAQAVYEQGQKTNLW